MLNLPKMPHIYLDSIPAGCFIEYQVLDTALLRGLEAPLRGPLTMNSKESPMNEEEINKEGEIKAFDEYDSKVIPPKPKPPENIVLREGEIVEDPNRPKKRGPFAWLRNKQ